MSVDPFIIRAKHYGSAYAMTNYQSKVHYGYVTASVNPTSRLRTTATLSLTASKASLDEVIMPDVSAKLEGALTHQDFTFPEMNLYSDLDYRMVDLALGISWQVAPSVTVTADANYSDLSDKAGYVYGIESGSLFTVRSGIRFDF